MFNNAVNGLDIFNPTDEHIMLRKTVRNFVRKTIEPGALERDRKEFFDRSIFYKMGQMGLLGLTVSPEYGGSGMDALASVIVHEEIAASDPGVALAYLAHSILCSNNISVNASDKQKKEFLPALCSGEMIGAMAMTEPECGTDALAMKTFATTENDSFFLNGRKMWITNGATDDSGKCADCVYVYARSGERNGRPEISTFIINGSTPGLVVGQVIKNKTGMRSSVTAELVFENCRVPLSSLVGKKGDSVKHMMRNLQIERVTLAAISIGIARRALNIMINYANERTAFGKKISNFGQIQKMIAESYAYYKACKSYVYNTSRFLALNSFNGRVDSDGSKLVSAYVGKQVSDAAIQVLGGYGYVSEYVVERLWRDSKLMEIGGGTIEAHHKNIANDLIKSIENGIE